MRKNIKKRTKSHAHLRISIFCSNFVAEIARIGFVHL